MPSHFYKPDHDEIEYLTELSPKDQLLSFIDVGADGDEPVKGIMQCNVREWFDEIERLQQRLTGELVHKCFVCEEVDSPRDGCDCVCCTVRRAEVKACRLLLDNTRMRFVLASLLDWWNDLPNDLKSDPALDPPPTAIKIALKICGTDEK